LLPEREFHMRDLEGVYKSASVDFSVLVSRSSTQIFGEMINVRMRPTNLEVEKRPKSCQKATKPHFVELSKIGAAMLTGHSEFFLSQPAIYFGVLGLTQDDFQELNSHADFQFNLSNSFFPPSLQPKTGMYIDWYDLPK